MQRTRPFFVYSQPTRFEGLKVTIPGYHDLFPEEHELYWAAVDDVNLCNWFPKSSTRRLHYSNNKLRGCLFIVGNPRKDDRVAYIFASLNRRPELEEWLEGSPV